MSVWREERGAREEEVKGWERKQHSIAKRPTDTKGGRMTGTRLKPARRNEEEGRRKGWRGRVVEGVLDTD